MKPPKPPRAVEAVEPPLGARADKRISVNKLAEYLESNPLRRRKIVFDAKYPQPFIVTRYRDAREKIKGYLCDTLSEDQLIEFKDELLKGPYHSTFEQQDDLGSSLAIESLLESEVEYREIDNKVHFDNESSLITIGELNISVNPDIIFKNGSQETIGGVKLHISKTNQLSDESQGIVALIVCEYFKQKGNAANPKCCFSFDIFKKSSIRAPQSYKLRLERVNAACTEICLWWDTL